MSQKLTTRFKKNGNTKGVAIRKNNNTPGLLRTIFNMAYAAHSKMKNGKSKS